MNDLPTCPDCGRRHLPVATRCPHCGHAFFRDPYEETTYEPRTRLGPVLLALVLVAAAGVGLWAVSRQGPLGPSVRPAPLTSPAPSPTATDTTPATVPPPAPVRAETIEAAAAPDPEPTPPPATRVATYSRWASTWTNVREAPDLDAPVVMILDPGERVEVGEREQGYFRVYVNGQPVGYVAGSLLLREPPAEQ